MALGDSLRRLDRRLLPPIARALLRVGHGPVRLRALSTVALFCAVVGAVTAAWAVDASRHRRVDAAADGRGRRPEGEPLAGYLAAADGELARLAATRVPGADEPTYALVSFSAYLGAGRLRSVLGEVPVAEAFARVNLPGRSGGRAAPAGVCGRRATCRRRCGRPPSADSGRRPVPGTGRHRARGRAAPGVRAAGGRRGGGGARLPVGMLLRLRRGDPRDAATAAGHRGRRRGPGRRPCAGGVESGPGGLLPAVARADRPGGRASAGANDMGGQAVGRARRGARRAPVADPTPSSPRPGTPGPAHSPLHAAPTRSAVPDGSVSPGATGHTGGSTCHTGRHRRHTATAAHRRRRNPRQSG